MKTLTAQQVKSRIESNPELKLVMTLGPTAFARCHIPGSINIWDIKDAEETIGREEEIIVYCSDKTCMASFHAYNLLIEAGYSKVYRFAGGLVEWSSAGLPLVENTTSTQS